VGRVELRGGLELDQGLIELAGSGEAAATVEVVLRGAQLGALEREPRVGIVWLEAQDLGVLRDGDVVFLADFGVVAAAQRARCGATAGEQGDRDQRRHAAAPAVRSGPGP